MIFNSVYKETLKPSGVLALGLQGLAAMATASWVDMVAKVVQR